MNASTHAQPELGQAEAATTATTASTDLAHPEPHPALSALCLVARLHHVAAEPAALAHALGKTPSEPLGADDLLLAARHLGLKARRSRPGAARLALAPLPAQAFLNLRTAVESAPLPFC